MTCMLMDMVQLMRIQNYLQKALKKIYGVTEETSEEDVWKVEKQMNEDMKKLVIDFRSKMTEYLGKE